MFDKNQNYERIDNGDVFTGQQAQRLYNLAKPEMQAVLLLTMMPTSKEATAPDNKYGPAG